MRWLLAWVFFGLGDLTSRIDRLLPDWRCTNLYPLYSWLMRRSNEFQGEQTIWGPWRAPSKEGTTE